MCHQLPRRTNNNSHMLYTNNWEIKKTYAKKLFKLELIALVFDVNEWKSTDNNVNSEYVPSWVRKADDKIEGRAKQTLTHTHTHKHHKKWKQYHATAQINETDWKYYCKF